MKKSLRSYLCLFLALSLTLAAGLPAFATPPVPQQQTTILFTHDLHSHFLPMPTESGGESGDMPACPPPSNLSGKNTPML